MTRIEKINKSCKNIQREINKLKQENVIIDYSGHSLKGFDHNIKPKKAIGSVDGEQYCYECQIVFEFEL